MIMISKFGEEIHAELQRKISERNYKTLEACHHYHFNSGASFQDENTLLKAQSKNNVEI